LGGKNFGYGHPHFPAMRAMREIGIAAVLADSFFPLYWRGEISNGFPQIAMAGISGWLNLGDEIEVNFSHSSITHLASREIRRFERYSRSEMEILDAGGFSAWLRQSLAGDSP